MEQKLRIYNTLSRKKEVFAPIAPPLVGMYICGPTVYSHVHLGNCRTFTSFDIVYRYLTHLGYKVRYVRNITDVGHLTDDADEGEDKIAKKARLENLEPMEIVQQYATDFHQVMDMLNNNPPSIEPTATGHLIEQIELVQTLLENGWAYESKGSVYFDVKKYQEAHNYGELSGRKLEELMAGFRELDGQDEKRNSIDFALWKKAQKGHIMRWNSPWGEGFPGWHLECSAMSAKYLGSQFDIHGGGMDLKFPHHECEIAQGTGAHGHAPVKYWMHANMLTINGQRMGKSVGNAILPRELFAGNHPLLDKGYSPMTLRFFMLQTHYGSTMDITVDALFAAEKAYKRLMNGLRISRQLEYHKVEDVAINQQAVKQIEQAIDTLYKGMNDDFNTAITLGGLFNLLKKINAIHSGQLHSAAIPQGVFERMLKLFQVFILDVLGLVEEQPTNPETAIEAMVEDYKEAKAVKDFERVDKIRARLKNMGIVMKDMKHSIDWAYAE